jgi:MFS family permease
MWFGCVGCAAATLLLYYGPVAIKDNFWVATVCAMLWGFLLSGFTSLPALLLSMGRPEDRGSAFAAYSLCAGLAAFVGPALVAVFRPLVGVHGLVWLFTALYDFLKSPASAALHRCSHRPEDRLPGNPRFRSAESALKPR